MNSSLMSTFFVRDIPEKMSEKHQTYASHLVNQLKYRGELILDFNGLQSSIDPTTAVDLVSATQEDDEKFDYEQFLTSYFLSTDVLCSLQVFKLRGLVRANPKFPLLEGMKQLNVLKELDLSGNDLSQFQNDLQFWGLIELQTLKLDQTKLTDLPASVGRLQKLQTLSLSNNNLSSLPVTLEFCQNLKYLSLANNKFTQLPSILLHLKNLEDLKRLGNDRLDKRYHGYEQWPHIITTELTKKKSNNPDSLQALTCRTIMTTRINYWTEENVPPLLCKMLDSYATQYNYCEKCHQSGSNSSMFVIKVMKLKFAGLNDVPFVLHSCQNCKESLKNALTDEQKATKDLMEEEYDLAMREAERTIGMTTVEINTSTRRHRRNRRRTHSKKCSIM